MSTIKVNKIENTSTTNGGVSIDNDGHVTIDGQQLPTTGPLSNRNMIINGAMVVSQRGTSHTSQHNNNNYGVDRWQVVCPNTSAVLVHSQETTGGPDGFKNWLKITPSTADTSISASDYSSLQQKIEGYNFSPAGYGTANAQNVTVSFKFKTNKAGTYCVCHRNAAADRNYLHEFTPVADGSWQTITYTVPGDTTGTWDTTSGLGWRFELFLANGSSLQSNTTDTWFGGSFFHSTSNQVNFLDSTSNELGITGVQVELGSKSTPFEHRSYGDELQRCQRYCYQISAIDETATHLPIAVGTMWTAGFFIGICYTPVSIRDPFDVDLEVSDVADVFILSGGTVATPTTLNNNPHHYANQIEVHFAASKTIGDGAWARLKPGLGNFFRIVSEL